MAVNSDVKPNKRLISDLTNTVDYNDLVRRGENESRTTRSRVAENGDVAIWKLQQFFDDSQEVERAIGIAQQAQDTHSRSARKFRRQHRDAEVDRGIVF